MDPEVDRFRRVVRDVSFEDAAVPPIVPTSRRSSAQLSCGEAVSPRGSIASGMSTLDGSRRTSRPHKSPAYQRSGDTIRENDSRARGESTAVDAMAMLLNTSRKHESAGSSQRRTDPAFKDGPLAPESSESLALKIPDGSSNGEIGLGLSGGDNQQNANLVPGAFVPTRTSSSRHVTKHHLPTDTGSSRRDRSLPRKSADVPRSETVQDERQTRPTQEQRPDAAANGLAESSKLGKSKRKKSTPPNILLDRPPRKLVTSVSSPCVYTPLSSRTVFGKENDPLAEKEVGARPDEDDYESAPAPAVRQSKARDRGGNTRSPSDVSSAGRPSREGHKAASSPAPSRRNTLLRRQSQPAEAKPSPRHRRTFSNPLRRNSNSSSGVRPPPQILVEDRPRPSTADSVEDAVDAYLCSPRLNQKIRQPDTRRVISFSEVGDSEGSAVFCCVGMGLTRYIMAFYDELALTLKLRLITLDRPGVGDSEPHGDGDGTPLGWPGEFSGRAAGFCGCRPKVFFLADVETDDVQAVCQALKITKFSILAHSAGAIYALAIALRMPQQIRGRIHLLAPWIPPSQLSVAMSAQQDYPPAGAVPTSQKILRALPTPIFRVANSSFMSATSASLTRSVPKSPRRKRKSTSGGRDTAGATRDSTPGPGDARDSLMYPGPQNGQDGSNGGPDTTDMTKLCANDDPEVVAAAAAAAVEVNRERQTTYDNRLAHTIWDLATTNANPAIDLLVCLERRQPIGFRYVDVDKAVVLHHGTRDTRVPIENVKWLGKAMRRCEVRVLEGEGHGLMASGSVMGSILMEIAREWDDWNDVVQQAKMRGHGAGVGVGVGAMASATARFGGMQRDGGGANETTIPVTDGVVANDDDKDNKDNSVSRPSVVSRPSRRQPWQWLTPASSTRRATTPTTAGNNSSAGDDSVGDDSIDTTGNSVRHQHAVGTATTTATAGGLSPRSQS